MSSDLLDQLASEFPEEAAATQPQPRPTASGPVGGDYERKLKRLGQRWRDVLDAAGPVAGYASASEADLALVNALVKRNFSDAEIWQTLRDSRRYQDRVKRKGQAHTDKLYGREIEKARELIVPFPPDEPRRHARPRQRAQPPPPRSGTAPKAAPKAAEPAAWTPSTSPQSFVSRYVAYASQRTDAPPAAHELMAVGMLSTLAGPNVRLPIAATVGGWRLVLWTLYIVNSTVGRKSTVINLARDILTGVLGDAALIEWEGSPQGLIQRLAERDGQSAVFLRDEYSGLLQQMNRGGHMAGLAQTLIRAYDGGVIENVRVRKKDRNTGEMKADTDRAANPYLPTMAASTRDSFVSRATIDNVLDGFLARFVIVSGHSTPRPMVTATAQMLALRDELTEHARRFHERAAALTQVELAPAVMDAVWQTEQAWIAEAEASEHPDAAAAAFKRLSESCLKVAALIAIDESEEVRVELPHYRAAIAMGQRWKASTLKLLDDLGATEFQTNCERILATVHQHPDGIQRGLLYKRHRRLRKRDFDEAIEALVVQELIDEVEGDSAGGRPPVLLYPVGEGGTPA